MKPEHFCSGNPCRDPRPGKAALASMKPEHFCSGNPLILDEADYLIKRLQ